MSAHSAADVLRAVAELLDSGLPVPTSIGGLYEHGRPLVQIDADDVPAWTTALGVAMPPRWERDPQDERWLHAKWPSGTFADAPFALAACRAPRPELAPAEREA